MTQAFSLFELAPGKTFAGRFRIVKPRRQTGLAAAFEAESDAGPCELLVFAPSLFEGPAQAAKYKQSWEPWSRVASPHVLRVREVFSPDPTSVVLVTDLPRGSSLRALFEQNGRIPAARVRELGLEILAGLEAIHAAGLVHGDVKPQTIFLESVPGASVPRAVLVDGGITTGLWNAKHLGEHTALIGTPFYAPVEQFGGDSPNVQSDVYNAATVLYELAAGVLPRSGRTIHEILQAKLEKSPPSIESRAPGAQVSARLEAAIAGGLMADRRARYRSAAEFRAALQAAS
jgi:serine/threonine-protein kinase